MRVCAVVCGRERERTQRAYQHSIAFLTCFRSGIFDFLAFFDCFLLATINLQGSYFSLSLLGGGFHKGKLDVSIVFLECGCCYRPLSRSLIKDFCV